MNDEPFVKVGLRDIYDAVMEMKGLVAPIPEKVTALEVRVTALEKWRWMSTGAATALGTGVGALLIKAVGA